MPERAFVPVEGLPPMTPEFILWRATFEGLMEASKAPRRRRARVLVETTAQVMADEETLAQIMPIRPEREAAEVAKARRQAVALFRTYSPIFLARLAPD